MMSLLTHKCSTPRRGCNCFRPRLSRTEKAAVNPAAGCLTDLENNGMGNNHIGELAPKLRDPVSLYPQHRENIS